MSPPEPPSRASTVALALAAVGGAGLFVALGCAVAVTGASGLPDVAVQQAVVGVRSPEATTAALALAELGSYPVIGLVTLIAVVVSTARGRTVRPAMVLVATVVGVAAAVMLVKTMVGRVRPAAELAIGLVSTSDSYPSGSTVNGTVAWVLGALTATLGAPRLVRVLVTVLAIAAAGTIGASRLYLSHHWASDVAASWLLGAATISGAVLMRRRVAQADPGLRASTT